MYVYKCLKPHDGRYCKCKAEELQNYKRIAKDLVTYISNGSKPVTPWSLKGQIAQRINRYPYLKVVLFERLPQTFSQSRRISFRKPDAPFSVTITGFWIMYLLEFQTVKKNNSSLFSSITHR